MSGRGINIADYIDLSTVKLPNGKTLEQTLKSEAQELVRILQRNIQEAYHDGTVYHRTNTLKNSIKVGDYCTVSFRTNGASGEIYVETDGSEFMPSIYGHTMVDALELLDKGYTTVNAPFRHIPWFGYRPAANFIEKSVAEFNAHSKYCTAVALR